MKAIQCELCGSNDFVKNGDYFECQYCHTKYKKEEAQKMMVEIDGKIDISGSTVKVDNTSELMNLYEVARRARRDQNSENAEKYYGEILMKDPSSWEASFYTTYYQSMNCKIGEVGMSANRITNCEETVFKLIQQNVIDPTEQQKAVQDVTTSLIKISNMLFSAFKNHYDKIDIEIRRNYTQEYINNCAAARDILYTAGDLLETIFGDKYGINAAMCWKAGVVQHNILLKVLADMQLNIKIMNKYNDKIKKYDSTYVAPIPNIRACYVATCVYGSYDCPEVWTLRRFRDEYLDLRKSGRLFIKTYYAISPKIIKAFGNTKWFQAINKSILDKLVARLNKKGYASTPYYDKN